MTSLKVPVRTLIAVFLLIKINKILIKINKIMHRPLLDLHGTGGRGLLSWPGAQYDDFYLTNIHGGLLGYTPPPPPAVGGVAHGPVNAHP